MRHWSALCGVMGTARVGRRRKERTFPELAGEGGCARLVVLAGEVEWSSAGSAQGSGSAGELLKASVEAVWRRRWAAMLTCAATKAYLCSITLGDGRGMSLPCMMSSAKTATARTAAALFLDFW